ncbi:glycoside hydrolase family 32 protein [Metabacillus sp. GX 13764]|uniref:glycoside hydrolase family 32 protein n=1 Tax=Metabacillus kandeliae TaxID=2900151 RepID=UPI001E2B7739|nr:glycoside hydrolase family 32 protein [Metabacillus kandeliae]MCD7034363.1 glycoside hydrolase family 32 protein [Metabacillus kandeliae]
MPVAYTEKFRPQFHFSPEANWMNDPNGMVYFNGEYHLFYQYHPCDTIWGPMHWGHAVSKDLIHWEHYPVALSPDENGMIFSGSAVVDWNNTTGFFPDEPGLVAIYTSADTYPDSDRPRQRQSIAYSRDNGRTWVKYEGNPVLSDVDRTDYRDPKVFFHEETGKWVMVLATGQSVTIYTSPNLIDWAFESEFGSKAGSHEGVWECPDLFKLSVDGNAGKQKWVLLVSIGDNPELEEGSRTQYFIGEFDGSVFVNDNSDDTVHWLDYGRDNYAGVSWSDIPDHDGRRIYIGWMSNWRYANQLPTKEWRSAMTLPRELSLYTGVNGVQLSQKPAAEIKEFRKKEHTYSEMTLLSNTEKVFTMPSPLLEVTAEIEKKDAGVFGICIQNANQEKTAILYNAGKGMLSVDRTNAGESSFSESFPSIQTAILELENNRLKLQILIDASSIEVFANGGKTAFTSLLFPNHPYEEIVLFSNEGSTAVKSFKLTELDSIWK